MSEAFKRVLARLRGNVKRRAGGGYEAHCSAVKHGKGQSDLDPSSSVKEGDDGRVLINRHAECSGGAARFVHDAQAAFRRRSDLRALYSDHMIVVIFTGVFMELTK